ncbi:MAG TPA: divalent-cation tolerance protein CutA [Planctomycetota bacterium]|nr:divalent-cation tolerance protein CutA [Planctomycetota bacterium]
MGEAGDGGAARVVLTTAPDRDTALRLARGLVAERLAACAQVLPGLTSVYRWEGSVQEEGEVLLLIKTSAECLVALERWLCSAHPYDTPECVALAPERVEPRYLAWLEAACAQEPPGA